MQTTRLRPQSKKRKHLTKTSKTPRNTRKHPQTQQQNDFSMLLPLDSTNSQSPLHANSVPSSRARKSSDTQSLKSTAQYDSITKRNPFYVHTEKTPNVPFSSLPEDQHYPTYRTHIRKCTDTIINVRRNNVEPYSYSHQIFAMHSVDPINFGESAHQLVKPTRLVLDGPEGIEALAYFDQAQSMPSNLDPHVSQLKSYAKYLLTTDLSQNDGKGDGKTDVDGTTSPSSTSDPASSSASSPASSSHLLTNTGLKAIQKSQLPTSLHTNSLIMHTTASSPSELLSTTSPSTPTSPPATTLSTPDLRLTNQHYKPHLQYAEISSSLKNIAYWGPNSGSVDAIVGQHYALPGMLVATTSQRTLGMVAALGGISTKVSSLEAAALMSGQPLSIFQSSNPILINLHGLLSQWTSPQDIISILSQFLGERAFQTAFGLQQGVCVELTDKGNQFTIEQMATICSSIGSLPNITSITVPTNATQFQYLRDTNRGIYNQIFNEYGPNLLEPDHKVKYTDTVDLDLSKVTPSISVHNASSTHGMNTVSCPLDYLDVITGENRQKELNLAKLCHIDNIAYHPALSVYSFVAPKKGEEFFMTNQKTGQRMKVLGNRYSQIDDVDPAGKLEKALNFDKVKDTTLGKSIDKISRKMNGQEIVENDKSDKNTGSDEQIKRVQNEGIELTLEEVQMEPDRATVGLSAQKSVEPLSSTPPTPTPPSSPTTSQTTSSDSQNSPQNAPKPQSKSLFASKKPSNPSTTTSPHQKSPQQQQPQQSTATYWPKSPNIILIRGSFIELKQTLKIWLQCLSEGLSPLVETLIQPDTSQTLHMLMNDPELCDENNTHIFQLLEKFSHTQSPSKTAPSIKFLTPGSGNIDYLLSDLIIRHEKAGNIPNRDEKATILTTDLGLSQFDAGIQQYAPHIFTSSNEYTGLTTFTGDLSFDPINSTLSPLKYTNNQNSAKQPSHSSETLQDDPNAFYLLPAHGVEPVIDANTNKLLVPPHMKTSSFQTETVLTPQHSFPSTLMNTEFTLKKRIDIQYQLFNSIYQEREKINFLPTFSDLEDNLGYPISSPVIREDIGDDVSNDDSQDNVKNLKKNQQNGKEKKQQQDNLLGSMNQYIMKPTTLGYQTSEQRLKNHQNVTNKSTSELIEEFVSPLSESIIPTYPSPWWNNDNLLDMPILANLDLPTSAADIAGLNQQLKFTPHQSLLLSTPSTSQSSPQSRFIKQAPPIQQKTPQSAHLTGWLMAKFNSTSHSSQSTSPDKSIPLDEDHYEVLSDVILRRMASTPRHLKSVFPFSQTQLQLRYAFSGLKSLSPGAISSINQPDFISTTQPDDGMMSNLNSNDQTPEKQTGKVQNSKFFQQNGQNSSSATKNALGFGLGMKLNELSTSYRDNTWSHFTEGLENDGQNSKNSRQTEKVQNKPVSSTFGVDFLSNETRPLWATHPTPSNIETNQTTEKTTQQQNNSTNSTISNDFINQMMPSIRTYLKLPQGRTHHETFGSSQIKSGGKVANQKLSHLLLPHSQSQSSSGLQHVQTLSWNYFLNSTKFALVVDGLNPKIQEMVRKSDHSYDSHMDPLYRWDQHGFGYGSVDECDQAAKVLKLFGCGAVLGSKIHANFQRALKAHGIVTLHCTNPGQVNNLNINDSLTVMTHAVEQEVAVEDNNTAEKVAVGDETHQAGDNTSSQDKVGADVDNGKNPTSETNTNGETKDDLKKTTSTTTPATTTKRRELFLPHQSPILVQHKNGNRLGQKGYNGETEIVETVAHYNIYDLAWFRSGNAVNAGVEHQLRTQLVDKALLHNSQAQQSQKS